MPAPIIKRQNKKLKKIKTPYTYVSQVGSSSECYAKKVFLSKDTTTEE